MGPYTLHFCLKFSIQESLNRDGMVAQLLALSLSQHSVGFFQLLQLLPVV